MNKQQLHGPTVFTLHPLLTAEECARLIEGSERRCYLRAAEGLPQKPLPGEKERHCAWCAAEDAELARLLWSRAAAFLPPPADGWQPERVQEQFWYFRLDPGEELPPQVGVRSDRGDQEAADAGPPGEAPAELGARLEPGWQGQLTLLVSLNDGFAGGETICYLYNGPLSVRPIRGQALLFPSYLTCQELPAPGGRRYVLRATVACRASGASQAGD